MAIWTRFFNRLGVILTAANIMFIVFIVWQLGREAHNCTAPVVAAPRVVLQVPGPSGSAGSEKGYAAVAEKDRPACDILLRHLSFIPDLPIYALSGYFRSGNSWTRHLLQKATGVVTGSIYNHAPLQRTGLWAEGVIEDTIITKTHQQNTTIFMFSDLMMMRQERKPNVPTKFFKSKGSIHLIRNPFDSIYSWFQYRQTGEHFMTSEEFNVDQWESHIVREVDEWIKDTHYWMHVQEEEPDYKLMIVRYEDLHNDTEDLLRRMLAFLEWRQIDEYRINCTLNATRCEKMTYNCRSGRAGLASLKYYSNMQREWMLEKLRPYLAHYGYPIELPMDSKLDYIVGIRTPGTQLPIFCRKSALFTKGVNAAVSRNLIPPKEKQKRPPRLYGKKPVILYWNAPLWPAWHKQGNFVNQWNQVEMLKPASKCEWTTNRAALPHSSAVLFAGMPHLNEHHREWCNKEYTVPRHKFFGQKWARFDYESGITYPILLNDDWKGLFDWSVGWHPSSDLRVGMKCQFPTNRNYRDPPPEKTPGNIVAYVASRCEAWMRDEIVKHMMDTVPLASLGKCVQNAEMSGDTPGSIPRRIDVKIREIGTFKFYLAFETANETDYVTEKLFHAFIAGTVPVYMGADNIDQYLPGPKSVIKASDFPDAETLGRYLLYLDGNDEEYKAYFKWKEHPLRGSFQEYDELCALDAGEKFCDMVIKSQKQAREEWEKDGGSRFVAEDQLEEDERDYKQPPAPYNEPEKKEIEESKEEEEVTDEKKEPEQVVEVSAEPTVPEEPETKVTDNAEEPKTKETEKEVNVDDIVDEVPAKKVEEKRGVMPVHVENAEKKKKERVEEAKADEYPEYKQPKQSEKKQKPEKGHKEAEKEKEKEGPPMDVVQDPAAARQ